MSNVVMLNRGVKFTTLVPLREENIKAAIGAVNNLPTFSDSLDALTDQVKSEVYEDFAVEFSGLLMDTDGFLVMDKARFTYTKHALAQAVSRIRPEGVVGMAGYLSVCPPDLRSLNYCYWHRDRYGTTDENVKGNNVILRVRLGQFNTLMLRAVVSQAYVAIDDVPILSSLNTIIPGGAHMRAVRGDVKSRFDILWPNRQHEVKSGDTIVVALRVVNSETGASSVRLEPMVYNAGSYNCYIIPRAGVDVSIRHIGEAKSRLERAYNNVMGQIDPFIQMLGSSYNDSILVHFKTIDQMFECLSKQYQLSEPKMAVIKSAYRLFPVDSRGGVADAMARAAQDMDLDVAEEVQRAAGLLVVNGWRPLTRFIKEDGNV